MDQMTARAAEAAASPPPQRLNEIVRRLKMELLSGRATQHDRGAGFNPYDTSSARDLWGRRRRA
jgi:hypothetical protein